MMPYDEVIQTATGESGLQNNDIEFDSYIPKYWADDNPVITSFFNAVSSVIPEGEKFFIQSIRSYEAEIDDPTLKDAVKLFIHQEADHSQQHCAMNNWVASLTDSNLKVEEKVRKNLKRIKMHSSRDSQLAGTVAMEHVSTVLSAIFLDNPALRRGFHPTISKLLLWHSKEEVEHRSVAYDVYSTTNHGYWHRISKLIFVSLIFLPMIAYIQLRFLMSEKQFFNVRAWCKAHWYFWILPGYFRKMLPGYFRYYKKNFHPSHEA